MYDLTPRMKRNRSLFRDMDAANRITYEPTGTRCGLLVRRCWLALRKRKKSTQRPPYRAPQHDYGPEKHYQQKK